MCMYAPPPPCSACLSPSCCLSTAVSLSRYGAPQGLWLLVGGGSGGILQQSSRAEWTRRAAETSVAVVGGMLCACAEGRGGLGGWEDGRVSCVVIDVDTVPTYT